MIEKLDWLDEIDFESMLTGDMKLIVERCGMDVLKSLLAGVPKIHVYMSEKPIVEAKKRYIEKHYRQGNAKDIAVKLGVSEYFVYKTHQSIVNERRKRKKEKVENHELF